MSLFRGKGRLVMLHQDTNGSRKGQWTATTSILNQGVWAYGETPAEAVEALRLRVLASEIDSSKKVRVSW